MFRCPKADVGLAIAYDDGPSVENSIDWTRLMGRVKIWIDAEEQYQRTGRIMDDHLRFTAGQNVYRSCMDEAVYDAVIAFMRRYGYTMYSANDPGDLPAIMPAPP